VYWAGGGCFGGWSICHDPFTQRNWAVIMGAGIVFVQCALLKLIGALSSYCSRSYDPDIGNCTH
jgi:hypothetical protein